MSIFALKGCICYSLTKEKVQIKKEHYVVCEDGICKGVFSQLPEKYKGIPVEDYGNRWIFPGFTDLHVHAPQYAFRGIGMDMELLDWLETHTFVEEARYKDIEYAKKAYTIFADDLKKSATTRACVFGTVHVDATIELMRLLEERKIASYVGKVNMDRNCTDKLCEKDAKKSVTDTRDWLKKWSESDVEYRFVKPILTPRFIPVCSDELMEGLSGIQKEGVLPVQSHLSENLGEIDWVRELCPAAMFYGDAYDRYDMFGKTVPTIMAHCVHSKEEEIARMKKNGVFIAHCPESNANLSSGIAPVRKYLDMDLSMGLGTDVAAGTNLSIFDVMVRAIQCSKLRWRLVDDSLPALKVEEVFYLATKGGGAFFGNVGSFEDSYEFDAVIMDDSSMLYPRDLLDRERLESLIYLSAEAKIIAKYVRGECVFRGKE